MHKNKGKQCHLNERPKTKSKAKKKPTKKKRNYGY